MATKARAKAKRRKTAKTARRRKTVGKTRTIKKKAAKKAPPRRAARPKAKPTAKVAVKPAPVSQRAQPQAIKPPPSRPAQPTAAEQRIGVVTHYYSHLSVVGVKLEPGYDAARWRSNPHPRTHHRFHPEGRVPQGRSCAGERGRAGRRFRTKGGRACTRTRHRVQSAIVAPLAGPSRRSGCACQVAAARAGSAGRPLSRLGGGRGGEGASLHALSLCMPPPCPSPASGGGDDVARIRQQPVGRNKRSALRH